MSALCQCILFAEDGCGDSKDSDAIKYVFTPGISLRGLVKLKKKHFLFINVVI